MDCSLPIFPQSATSLGVDPAAISISSRPLYFLVVKSISLLELPPAEPDLSQVQAPADLRPHAHEAPEAGLTFSVAALSQEHWRAGFAPQEQVAFWAVCEGGQMSAAVNVEQWEEELVGLPQTQDSPPLPQQVVGFATEAIVICKVGLCSGLLVVGVYGLQVNWRSEQNIRYVCYCLLVCLICWLIDAEGVRED